MKYEVLRSHYGDKMYEAGDTRDLSEADAKHLVDSGVLKKARESKKIEEAPQNKAESAPKNKGK